MLFVTGNYKLLLSSDEEVFGGWRNLSKETDGDHVSFGVSVRACYITVYVAYVIDPASYAVIC
jgi:hypothetical protein